MKKILIIGFALALIMNFSADVMAAAGKVSETTAGAADFTLSDLKGNSVSLSSFKSKKVLLVFGATWCPYCVMEVGDLNAFYQKHQDKDVKLIYIDIKESAAKVSAFVQKHKINYTVLLDTDGNVANKYNVYGIPANFLIDEKGVIKYSGSKPDAGFESLLK